MQFFNSLNYINKEFFPQVIIEVPKSINGNAKIQIINVKNKFKTKFNYFYYYINFKYLSSYLCFIYDKSDIISIVIVNNKNIANIIIFDIISFSKYFN